MVTESMSGVEASEVAAAHAGLVFTVERPRFSAAEATADFHYRLGDLHFVETLTFPELPDRSAADRPAFARLLELAAIVLGVSYFKLKAPFRIATPDMPLNEDERAFVLDVYENGLGEFYARNDLKRFGRLTLDAPAPPSSDIPAPALPDRALLPMGGGKDSLVSVQLLEAAEVDFTPFAVNPKGPIVTSVDQIGKPPVYVTRRLDPEMIRLGQQPGYYNGHVPSTAINSMIAALCAVLYGYNRIVLSNERSASEGNVVFDGRDANHQYSKSLAFEARIAAVLSGATGGALGYFSLLRPFSEARIARLFARQTRFDRVFSSCNRNFRLNGHDGPLWCGECPKCHFVFLIFAPVMDKARLIGIFGKDLLDRPENEGSYRELTGLAGQKPWECVGEILEAAACLYALTLRPEWAGMAIVSRLGPELLTQYGRDKLETALEDLMTDSPDHHLPKALAERIAHAL
jgi:UDP-N-acetyl-alpha-D-muramoyl-L-alanyl-L-glutamate epimerase